jgi:hypothetical protein
VWVNESGHGHRKTHVAIADLLRKASKGKKIPEGFRAKGEKPVDHTFTIESSGSSSQSGQLPVFNLI